MVNTRQIARAFTRKTNFRVKVNDGGFAELRNHVFGKPIRESEPAVTLHLVKHWKSGKGTGLRGDFTFYRRPGYQGDLNPTVTAHDDGTFTVKADGVSHKELAFALKHARTLQRIMKEKSKRG